MSERIAESDLSAAIFLQRFICNDLSAAIYLQRSICSDQKRPIPQVAPKRNPAEGLKYQVAFGHAGETTLRPETIFPAAISTRTIS